MEKKTGMRLSHICCLFYQLCFLSNGITSGLQPLGETEEWEIVYPALWSTIQQESTGGSGAGGSCNPDGNCGNSRGNISTASASGQVMGSSREVRSVSSSSDGQLQPGEEASEDEGSEDEYESQEFYHWSPLSQGYNATFQLPPSPPQSPPSEDGDEVLLRIPAFAQELYLLLKRDSRFLAPGFAVEERLRSERRSISSSAQTQIERSCYYSGSVLYYPGSFASFSTCGGLSFYIGQKYSAIMDTEWDIYPGLVHVKKVPCSLKQRSTESSPVSNSSYSDASGSRV
ncbi:UNVERIFIED_CONTAM: hypothetical protein K2H54_053774 [Gekko kuhli]